MSRPAVIALVAPLAFALALAACGGGPRHIEEITPAVQDRLSGVWHLNAEESDDPEEAMRRPEGARPRGGVQPPGGGRPGGATGGRGGMPGGTPGAMPGGRAGIGPRRMDPRAAEAVRRMLTVPPRRVEIALTDSLVRVQYAGEEAWLLPFGEKVKRDLDDDLEVEAEAEWEEGRVVVTRQVSGGAVVRETFMPSVDGRRLTVAVEASLGGPGGVVELRRVYDAEAR